MSTNLSFADDFYLTLPDNIDLKSKLNKKFISKNLFLFLFFLFRWFIFEETIRKNFIIFFFNTNCINYIKFKFLKYNLRFFFIKYYLYFKYKLYFFLNISNIYKFTLKDVNLYILLYLLKRNIYIQKYKFDNLYLKKKLRIFFFTDFKLRLPLFLFTGYKKYMQFFRLYKYNEYLSYHPVLYNYPLLKFILRNNWRGHNKNKNLIYFNQNSTNLFFNVYFFNFEKNSNFILFFNYNWINILLFIDKFKFIKLASIFNKNVYIFLFNYFKIYFLNIFFLYIYNFWLYYYIERHLDATFANRWRIYYMLHLHWWLEKYIENLPSWLYMLFIIYLVKMFFSNYIYLYNFSSLLLIKNKKIFISSFSNLCIYKIINLIFNCYLDNLYFKFYKLLLTRNYGTKRITNLWDIFFRNYVFEYTDISFFYNNDLNIFNYYKNFKYTFDYIHWQLFFISNFINKNMLNNNFISLFNKLKIDNIVQNVFNIYIEYIYSILNCKFKNYSLYNFYYIYIYLQDLFYKIIFSNKEISNKFFPFIILNNYLFFSNFKHYQFKYFLWKFNHNNGILHFNNYYNKYYNNYYYWIYEFRLKYILYIIYINIYLE